MQKNKHITAFLIAYLSIPLILVKVSFRLATKAYQRLTIASGGLYLLVCKICNGKSVYMLNLGRRKITEKPQRRRKFRFTKYRSVKTTNIASCKVGDDSIHRIPATPQTLCPSHLEYGLEISIVSAQLSCKEIESK